MGTTVSEQPAPYGHAPVSVTTGGRIRIHHLQQMKERGERWAMLTAYDMYTAATFDDAGIPVLLVGDSAANNVYGYETSLPVTVDELIPLARAVSRSARRALVIADLPFGSYQASPEQCFHTAARFMKEANVHAVKLEGGEEMTPQVELLAKSGIPVMAHIGFTPQSEHTLGGYRVQGRGDDAGRLITAAKALEAAGAFALLIEMIPGDVAAEISRSVSIPTVGIGAGNGCDAQVLVWQDMAGLRTGRLPRFVKQYADMNAVLRTAAQQYAADVADGSFPAAQHAQPVMLLSRISFDILGRLAGDECDVRVHTARPGRTIELVEATVAMGSRTVVSARAWYMAPVDTVLVAGGVARPLPAPDSVTPWPFAARWPGGFVKSLEVRPTTPPVAGRTTVWLRTAVDLVEGEAASELASYLALVDTANGIAAREAPDRWMFPNIDLTVHLHRQPTGPWVGLDSTAVFGPSGLGVTSSVLHDQTGPVGHAQQSLTVRPVTRKETDNQGRSP